MISLLSITVLMYLDITVFNSINFISHTTDETLIITNVIFITENIIWNVWFFLVSFLWIQGTINVVNIIEIKTSL